MSDDSFFREVSEELRQDRVKAFWARFGTTIITVVVVVILAAAAFVGWQRYQASQAAAAGDRYMAALDSAEAGDAEAALQAFEAIAADGHGAYPALARLRIGALHAEQGDADAAVAAFDRVVEGGDAPQPLEDTAAVRAAYVLVDSGSLADVRNRVERLTGDSEPLRFPAREAIATAAWKAGDIETARSLYQGLADDSGTPNGIRERAGMMLDVMATGDAAQSVDVPDVAPPPAPDAGSNAGGSPSGLDQLLGGGGAAPSGSGSPDGNAGGTSGPGGVALPTTNLGSQGSENASGGAGVPNGAANDAPASGPEDAAPGGAGGDASAPAE